MPFDIASRRSSPAKSGFSPARQIFQSLLGYEVIFDEIVIALRVVPYEGIGTEAVHKAESVGDTPVAENNGHLVNALRCERKEIPLRVGVGEIGARIFLLRVDEIGEFYRIPYEKYRRIVPHYVEDTVLGIEFDGEAAGISHGIRGVPSPRHGRKSREHLGFFADFAKYFGNRVARNVVRHGEFAVRAPAFGVHHSFGNAFAVEARQFVDKLRISQQYIPVRGRKTEIVVSHRFAELLRKNIVLSHIYLLFHNICGTNAECRQISRLRL